MQILEPRALFQGEKRFISTPGNVSSYFEIWKEYASKAGVKDFDFNSFVAGWIISGNNTLKEEALQLIHNKRKMEKYDARVN